MGAKARRIVILGVAILIAVTCAACAPSSRVDIPATGPAPSQSVATSATAVSPAPGITGSAVMSLGSRDPERVAVIEALRTVVEEDLGQPVKFEVYQINELSPYAWVAATPFRPDGRDIDFGAINKYAPAVRAEAFDPGLAALLVKEGGDWHVLKWEVGATDVAWEAWTQQYPVIDRITGGTPPE